MIKKVLWFIPDFFIVSIALFWFLENYLESGLINYYALFAAFLVVVAAMSKVRLLGMLMGALTVLFSIFLGFRFYALYSEIKAIPNASSLTFLLMGIFIVSLLSGLLLFFKYYKRTERND